jgi:hypothetical protein
MMASIEDERAARRLGDAERALAFLVFAILLGVLAPTAAHACECFESSLEELRTTLAETPTLHYVRVVGIASRECDEYEEKCTFVLRVAVDATDGELQNATLRYDMHRVMESCVDFDPDRIEGDLIAHLVERERATELFLVPCLNRARAAEYAQATFAAPAADAGCASCETAQVEHRGLFVLVALAWRTRARRR